MAKYILFVGPCSLLFIINFGALYFDSEYTEQILRSYIAQDFTSLNPVCFEAMKIAVRASALLGAASAFLSIYLFRVMVMIERGRLIAFLGIMVGGSLALGTTTAALSFYNITWLAVLHGLLFIPITIGLFMGLFGNSETANA